MDYDRPVPPPELRRISKLFGALFLITFVTSIPAVWLSQPVLDNPAGYIAGAGHDTRVLLGVFLELLLIIANIGTAIVIYALVKRVNEVCAIGYVTARVMECTFIIAVLGVVGLRESPPSGSDAALGQVAYTLAAIKDWTFLLGPGFVIGVAMLGLVGGPLVCITGIAVMFRADTPSGPLQGIATLPEARWELLLGIYPLVWGFKADAPILTGERREDPPRWEGTAAVATG